MLYLSFEIATELSIYVTPHVICCNSCGSKSHVEKSVGSLGLQRGSKWTLMEPYQIDISLENVKNYLNNEPKRGASGTVSRLYQQS